MNHFKHLFALGFWIFFPRLAFVDRYDACPPPSLYDRPLTWKTRMRLNTLKNLDEFLNWSFGEKFKTYAMPDPLQKEKIEVDIPEMRFFVENYGYFSFNHPIIAKVSSDRQDLEIIRSLLEVLYKKVENSTYLQIAVAEVMTKALAYYDLKLGQSIMIPVEVGDKVVLERFVVDRIFNLWHGMPAFGLVPERKGIASILLFRGTDFSLDSKRGWASLMSDLDMAGPGLTAFQNSEKEISTWLETIYNKGKPARVMGFSLGGALAEYTFIYENKWLSDRGSISICPPGVREKVISDWRLLPEERQKGLICYINLGDIVPKVGKLFGNVYALSTSKSYKPLTAHTMLVTSEPHFYKTKIDVDQENSVRK